jgi:hypothetical protein
LEPEDDHAQTPPSAASCCRGVGVCVPNSFRSSLVLYSNRGGFRVSHNAIAGSLETINNTVSPGARPDGRPATHVMTGNSIGGSLVCSANVPPLSDEGNPNRVTESFLGQAGSGLVRPVPDRESPYCSKRSRGQTRAVRPGVDDALPAAYGDHHRGPSASTHADDGAETGLSRTGWVLITAFWLASTPTGIGAGTRFCSVAAKRAGAPHNFDAEGASSRAMLFRGAAVRYLALPWLVTAARQLTDVCASAWLGSAHRRRAACSTRKR